MNKVIAHFMAKNDIGPGEVILTGIHIDEITDQWIRAYLSLYTCAKDAREIIVPESATSFIFD